MSEDILLSVCSPPEIDLDIFANWVEGYSVEEVAKFSLFKGNTFEFVYRVEECSADMMRMFQYDISDQFRYFDILEHFLMQPQLLKEQTLCAISPDILQFMIEKYWQLDDIFARELLKKLNKSRKDLEDASETTGLRLRSVMRQFDNIKRITAAFEDTANLTESTFQFIHKTYLLPPILAQKYTCLIYLMDSKFNLTAKKRLMRLPYPSLENCAALTMTYLNLDATTFATVFDMDAHGDPTVFLDNSSFAWNFVWKVFPTIEQYEVDKQLMNSLRDLRNLMTGEVLDLGCNHVRSRLSGSIQRRLEGSNSTLSSSSSRLRNTIKSLLLLGANLSQTKEFRDLFEDILSKVAEPLEEAGLTLGEITIVMSACYYVAVEIPETVGRSLRSASEISTSVRATSQTVDSMSQSRRISMPSKVAAVRSDWLRFLTFCKLTVEEMLSTDRSRY